ncbi:hypothetical protein A2619_05210 [candidate division WWE3 bacterium RIFOXYD1_FULL_39_9]|uniref:Uncharacterized protein n=1 Tax=candidate division WWE3 bacterium RIFOXYD1_FULL_39_9 TaxID=1802649 RepID=A0A1F4X8T9_UNCKA|nr:MAG: hypothetical protein A2619_05210 [candidate division WWE3 bacterium RIFOXYD1_FULL_39_9]
MLKLESAIEKVAKVGPKYTKLLKNLEIETVGDLLYHFPFRYDDFSNVKSVSDLQVGDSVTIKGVLGPVENIFTKYGKKLTKSAISDNSGALTLIWFNQHFLKKVLMAGTRYSVSGKITLFNNKPCILNPEMEIAHAESLNTGRLVPVYPETSGVSSKWLRTRVWEILHTLEKLEEFIPYEILEKYNYPQLDSAIRSIHFPNDEMGVKHSTARLSFEEMFLELLKVEKRKNEWNAQKNGIKLNGGDGAIDKFISELPFGLTESQKKVITEIKKDMEKEVPMNRLLEGDVGTGKTIVAIVAALTAKLNGFKTVYMAPTVILAQQHFETFNNFLKQEAKIALMTGTKKEGIDSDWDILIGTHSILYNNEKYKNVALVVIDEQHRFGVDQRGKVLEMSGSDKIPHLLTMTATPIPRTLALTIYGDLSISVLDQHPNTKRKIVTKVVANKNREEAYEWIKKSGESAFIVCPLIEGSESETLVDVKAAEEEYRKLNTTVFKDVEMGLIHGRMKAADKQKAITDFRDGAIKILVATPVIEVGIDIPDATIMVIESAERYGLANLHQLRGRVGRGSKQGFCFVFMSDDSKKAYTRLKYLESVESGIELAEIDLKMRGEGDIFSTTQHGFKKFRLADLGDFELLERAKTEAQNIYPLLDRYESLKTKLQEFAGNYVKNN